MKPSNIWSTYDAWLSNGTRSRDAARAQMLSRLERKLPSSLSYRSVTIGGIERSVAIIDDTDLNKKKVYSLNSDDLPHGELVYWADTVWLITEKNAAVDVYAEAIMERCNYKLKWIDDAGNLLERWCIVEDGTKYLAGERYEQIMSIGDARIALTIGKDSDTSKIGRGKRFLIDDPDGDSVLAYELTKPNRLFNVYDNRGVFRYILSETNLTDNDNIELMVADYYSWEPKVDMPQSDVVTGETLETVVSKAQKEKDAKKERAEDKGVWL